MKKVFAALCAAVMVLGSAMTALAAPSASADNVTMAAVESLNKATVTAENGVEVKTEALSSTSEAAKTIKEEIVEILQAANNANNKTNTATVLSLANVTVPSEIPEGGIKLTFEVSGILSTDKVENIKVLHFDGNGWEEIKVNSVSGGKVTATFTSLSPVAVVRVVPEPAQTGVAFSTLSLIAAAGLAGAVVCGKKKSN